VKILATVKRVPDPETSIKVKPDGSGIVTEGSEVVLVTVSADVDRDGKYLAQEQLRTGLAMGADRAILVGTDAVLDPLGVARVLAKIVETEKPDLVLMGKQAIDDDSNAVGQMLAELLGWPQATFASKV
jgi:electron transfer flavoprotein beta subunit